MREWPVQKVRSLTSEERIELRSALVARGALLADLIRRGEDVDRLTIAKGTVDALNRDLDEIRIEVDR